MTVERALEWAAYVAWLFMGFAIGQAVRSLMGL